MALPTLILTLASIANAPIQEVSSPDKVTVCSERQHFRGKITPSSAAQVVNELQLCKPKTLVLSSEGGDEAAALIILRALRRNGINLEIKDACLSACAQIVMLGMPSVRVHKFSIVGFHHSSIAINEWSSMHATNSRIHKDISIGSQAISLDTKMVIEGEGRRNLLRFAFKFVEPQCLSEGGKESDGQWMISMKRQFWLPRRVELERAGLLISGDWENVPSNISGVNNTNFVNSDYSIANTIYDEVGRLSICPKEQ